MTFHRFLYKLCWRSRYVLPLLLVGVIVVGLVLSGPGTKVQYSQDGRVRIKYKHQHGLVPNVENLKPKPIAYPDHGDHDHKPGEVPPVHLVARGPGDRFKPIRGDNSFDQNQDELNPNLPQANLDYVENKKLNPVLLKANKDHQKKSLIKSKKLVPGRKSSTYHDRVRPPDIFNKWSELREPSCDGKFVGYANEFAFLSQVLLNKKDFHSSRKGGESIEDVLNQPEEFEYFTYNMGCFQTPCSHRPLYYFNNKNHVNDWMENLKTKNLASGKPDTLNTDFTIAITRYEYVNIYHTMTDWYNAFLLMEYFQKLQKETNILFVDSHPIGALDPVWPVLFNSTTRVGHLADTTVYTNLVWGMLGYNSPLLEFFNPSLPLVEEFREFFLNSYRISTTRKLDCDKLNIVFIWRRDYLAHPRNPSGTVSRKFGNERELLKAVQRQYKDHKVRGVQIDLFDMQQQLLFISNADILIGMHGAGLTHALFLQKHAGVIEFVPNYFSSSNEHFSAIACWRKLHYEKWVNTDVSNELPNDKTKIPPHLMIAILKGMIKRVCEPYKPVNRTDITSLESYFEPKFIEPTDIVREETDVNVNSSIATRQLYDTKEAESQNRDQEQNKQMNSV